MLIASNLIICTVKLEAHINKKKYDTYKFVIKVNVNDLNRLHLKYIVCSIWFVGIKHFHSIRKIYTAIRITTNTRQPLNIPACMVKKS